MSRTIVFLHKHPTRYVTKMKNQFSLATFLRKYKDDESCLAEIFKIKYPKGAKCQNKKCKYFEQISNFYKIKGRMVYQCSCGYQIAPLAGTIFEKTTTPFQYWFYAMFVMSNTRSGVSAKQLQRELAGYYHLPKFGYYHESVNHRLESVRGEVHTQGIENFWSHFKRGVTGVYRVVSKKYLQAYVDEYGFRFNHRNEPMFEVLLGQINGVRVLKT